MAKILVADDNSNIQKMVGLALKDQGIEVIAVGNGEAAVRKISDLRPDLVLADVFMPVRNGYEVCKYVKDDKALSHIPVILLVGAFDPLDEQEAQRVGADGVLKKPFVPPDPLISMVKSALARAGVSTNSERAEEPKAAAPVPTPPPLVEASTPLNSPAVFGLSPELADQSFVEEITARPAAINFGAGRQPVAFGSLLNTEEETADSGCIAPAHPELAAERDWKSSNEEEIQEEDTEETPPSSWRRDGTDEAFVDDSRPAPAHDWRDRLVEGEVSTDSSSTYWTPTKEKTEFVEAAETHAPIFASDAWPAAIPSGAQESAVAVKEESRAPKTAVAEEAPAALSAYSPAKEEKIESTLQAAAADPAPAPSAAQQTETRPESPSWLSVSASPWDVEARKANELAAAWDAPVLATIPNAAPVEAPKAEALAAVLQAAPLDATQELPAATVEAIREEASHFAEEAAHEAVAPELPAPEEPAAEVKNEPAAAAKLNIDEMVAKVLSKLSPEVLQAVTREILKPVIESMVRDEINSKK